MYDCLFVHFKLGLHSEWLSPRSCSFVVALFKSLFWGARRSFVSVYNIL